MRGSKSIDVVMEPGSSLVWKFLIASPDISFAVYFRATNEIRPGNGIGGGESTVVELGVRAAGLGDNSLVVHRRTR
jgi:hypothetical protein